MAASTSSTCSSFLPTELVNNAVAFVLNDHGFSLPSASAMKARELAETVEQWRNEDDNIATWNNFAGDLVTLLRTCFPKAVPPKNKCKSTRERMWEQYYKLRSSDKFIQLWKKLFECIKPAQTQSPIFWQFVTQKVMEDLIKEEYKCIEDREMKKLDETSLDYQERNALRYTVGYVLNSLLKKLQRSKKREVELIMYVHKLIEEETDEEAVQELDSKEWVNSVDRGGLVHVSDLMYSLFVELELVLRHHINSQQACRDFNLSAVAAAMIEDEDVLFYWSMLSVELQEEATSKKLLYMMVEHWITIRGFSHASALMEQYKQNQKKCLQKSKGLRKGLYKVHED